MVRMSTKILTESHQQVMDTPFSGNLTDFDALGPCALRALHSTASPELHPREKPLYLESWWK